MNYRFKRLFIAIITIITTISCSKNEGVDSNYIYDPTQLEAIIVSEGQFGYGTGSVTALYKDGEVEQDIFRRVNGRPLGDIPQSITKIGGYYYIPVNNSQKIEVVAAQSFKSIETMTIDHPSVPMYVEYLGGDSIIVSDQSSSALEGKPSKSSLIIMDINHDTKRNYSRRLIEMSYPTFQMKNVGGKLFVASKEFSVFDLASLKTGKERKILYNENPIEVVDFSKLCLDNNNNLWVMANDGIYQIDIDSEEVTFIIPIEASKIFEGHIDISCDGETLFYNIGSDIYMVNTAQPSAPIEPIIEHSNNDNLWSTYAIAASTHNTIYISRVMIGSVTRGKVYEYSLDGKPINSFINNFGNKQHYFSAGIFPSFIFIAE